MSGCQVTTLTYANVHFYNACYLLSLGPEIRRKNSFSRTLQSEKNNNNQGKQESGGKSQLGNYMQMFQFRPDYKQI